MTVVSLALGGVLCLGVSLVVPPRRLSRFSRGICRLILLSSGQVLRVRGSFPPLCEGPYIYVFNHTSLLDTFVVMAVIPEFTAAVGKKEQFSIPLWNWILQRWGVVGIDRSVPAEAIAGLARVEESLLQGTSLLISPEGTRSSDGSLGTFKKGPFHLALNTGSTLMPMIIRGAFDAKRKGSWLIRPGFIDVEVLDPLPSSQWRGATVDALRRELQELFQQSL